MPTKSFLDNVKVTNKDGSPLGSPVSSYELSDFDVSGDPIYVGSIRADGAWMITEFDIANGQTRYVQGLTGYSTAWTNRASQSYDYFSEVF